MSRFLPVANPPSRFATSIREYDDGEVVGAPLQVFEDHSRSILATNDSPDVGFRWSVNPYRGCWHACRYCADGDTQVLMASGSTRALRDVRVGDEIYGTEVRGSYRRFVTTRVLAHWQTVKRAHRVRLADGTELIASGDHRFLTERGWKHVTGTEHGASRRPFLTTRNRMFGVGALEATPDVTPDYKRGYLTGMIRGDAVLKVFRYQRPGRQNGDIHMFRLALVDVEPLRRVREYLREIEVELSHEYVFARATGTTKEVVAVRTHARGSVAKLMEVVAWPGAESFEWSRGFLAGIFDAEGSYNQGVLRIANKDVRILEETMRCARAFGFDVVLETPSQAERASTVRVRGGLREHLRFFQLVDPAIRRKRSIEGMALKQPKRLRVVSIEDLGFDMLMYDITTGTGDFIANGVVSHNCYARPSHEYLSFGAGTDFDRKIVVKPKAPELLREAFEKKSWKGELVVFSGITDCYQPLEHAMKLTRGCLEVCLEYKNPVGIITKSPIIERDVELLAELAKTTSSCRVSISIPFWNVEASRAMEPFVTTPARRMKIVETLAKAGVPVGVSVSPIVPGLNDGDIGEVLQAAHDAGATHAFYVLLRLPGAVRDVFEKALREKLPLRAEKVLRRLREAHGGKLYDARFGVRGRGDSVYAKSIEALFTRTAVRLGLRDVGDPMNHEGQRDLRERVPRESRGYGDRTATETSFARPDRSKQTSFGF